MIYVGFLCTTYSVDIKFKLIWIPKAEITEYHLFSTLKLIVRLSIMLPLLVICTKH